MTTEDNPILNRIKKLLALAGSSNEQEAKVAMSKANELLVKYNLDIQQVRMSQDDYEFAQVTEGKRARPHHRHIFGVLQSYFFVNVIHQRKWIGEQLAYVHFTNLVGKPVNCKIAAHVFEFLDKVYPELWKSFKAKFDVTEKDRYSYFQGLHWG